VRALVTGSLTYTVQPLPDYRKPQAEENTSGALP
jgi:hypothetical protein